MTGIYLGSCIDKHPNYDLKTNDIRPLKGVDVVGDMMQIDLAKYDYIVASPPCNYWSRAVNYDRMSNYAKNTKHLLPDILEKLGKLDKPFLVENVINRVRMRDNGVFEIADKYAMYIYFVGRHTYFTNVLCNLDCEQPCEYIKNLNSKNEYRQGFQNVHRVIEIWLKFIGADK